MRVAVPETVTDPPKGISVLPTDAVTAVVPAASPGPGTPSTAPAAQHPSRQRRPSVRRGVRMARRVCTRSRLDALAVLAHAKHQHVRAVVANPLAVAGTVQGQRPDRVRPRWKVYAEFQRPL